MARQLQEEARARAWSLGLKDLATRVVVRWNSRLQTTAGTAQAHTARISLNPRLLVYPEELTRTFLHELAHLVAFARHPTRRIDPHGSEWRRACVDLGLADEHRCHTLTLAERRRVTRPYLYHCPGCRKEVRRVRPFRRKEACLVCCRIHAKGKYDRRFSFVVGPAMAVSAIEATRGFVQSELFQL